MGSTTIASIRNFRRHRVTANQYARGSPKTNKVTVVHHANCMLTQTASKSMLILPEIGSRAGAESPCRLHGAQSRATTRRQVDPWPTIGLPRPVPGGDKHQSELPKSVPCPARLVRA